MTIQRALRTSAMLCLLSTGACGTPPQEAAAPPAPAAQAPKRDRLSLHHDYRALRFDVPSEHGKPTDLLLCKSAPVVLVSGGVYDPGHDRWLIPRRTPAIDRADCDDDGNLYVISGKRLARVGDKGSEALGSLPGDGFRVAWSGKSLLFWGRAPDGDSVLLEWDRENGPTWLWSGQATIGPADRVGAHAIVAALDEDLALLGGGEAQRFARAGKGVDALALDVDGSIYTSSARGIERLRKGEPPVLIAKGVRGPLRVRLGTVYVLLAEKGTVLRLDPARRPDVQRK